MHCEVSTFPAATAADGPGFSIEDAGTRIVSGLRHPSLSGKSAATSVRNT